MREKYPDDADQKKELALVAIDVEMQKIFDEAILKKDERPDGRKLDEVRPISCQVGILAPHSRHRLFSPAEKLRLSPR